VSTVGVSFVRVSSQSDAAFRFGTVSTRDF